VTAVAGVAETRRRGRPPCCAPELARRILQLHRQGLSLQAISEVLNREGVPTPTGRPRWSKSYVDRLLHTRYVQDIATGRFATAG
jgi:Recombinase